MDTPEDRPEHPPAPGWYDDPASPGRPRWWDGDKWGPVTPPPGVPGVQGHGGRPADPSQLNLVEEHNSARRARVFLWVGFVSLSLNAVLNLAMIDWLRGELPRMTDAVEDGLVYEPQLTGSFAAVSGLSNLTFLGTLAAGAMFLVWVHRAVVNAGALGQPLKHGPGWSVGGFVLPIIQYWFPYQTMRDLFPAGHPARQVVRRWFAAWLVAQLLATPTLVVGLISYPVAYALAGVNVVLYLVAVLLARRLVAESVTAHQQAAEQAGHVAAGADLATLAAAPPEAVVDPWARAAGRDITNT
jgi:hypothetical protein